MAATHRKDTPAEIHFLQNVGEAHVGAEDIEAAWKKIPRTKQDEMYRRIWEALISGDMDPHDLESKFRSVQNSRILKPLFPDEACQGIARLFIQRKPTAMGAYELATLVWGTGIMPVDILILFISCKHKMADIRRDEINDRNREMVSMELARRCDLQSLEQLYPTGIPETYVRRCLSAMEGEHKKDFSFEILQCHIFLKDWESVRHMLTHSRSDDLLQKAKEITALMQGKPKKALSIAAVWLAQAGQCELLQSLYNPVHGGKETIGTWTNPPKQFLRICMEKNVRLIPNGELHQQNAAACCVMLQDWERAKLLLQVCTYDEPVAHLLLHLHKNGQSIPKAKRS